MSLNTVDSAIDSLRNAVTEYDASVQKDPTLLITAAGLLILSAIATGLGECRLQTPYSRLHPVISSNGVFQWCCDHNPEHCR